MISIRAFIIRILVFSILVFFAGNYLSTLSDRFPSFNEFAFLQVIVVSVTLIVHFYLISSIKTVQRPQQIVLKFMTATVFKLLFYLFLGIGYVVFTKYLMNLTLVYSGVFAAFFVLYLIYTFFEVYWIVKFVKKEAN